MVQLTSGGAFCAKQFHKLMFSLCVSAACVITALSFQQQSFQNQPADAVEAAQRSAAPALAWRPEQQKTEHDRSPMFNMSNAEPSSPVFHSQPKEGRISGFDFYRDPLNADFTEFEQRTAYFNGDEIHAIKKGMNILDRIQVSHMAQMQNMFDFTRLLSWIRPPDV